MDFLIVFGGLYLLLPIVGLIAFMKAHKQSARIDKMQLTISNLNLHIRKLQNTIDSDTALNPVKDLKPQFDTDDHINSEDATDKIHNISVSMEGDKFDTIHDIPQQKWAAPKQAHTAAPTQTDHLTTSPPPPQSHPQTTRPAGTKQKPTINWEKRIASNWMVWAGGFALAIGGLFLVRTAIDAGLFNMSPIGRCIAGAVFGFALIATSFRADKWPLVSGAQNALRFLPQILAGAGIITLYGSALASSALYTLIPPLSSLIAYAAISIFSIMLAMRYGSTLAAIGITGAYITPFFTGAESGSPLLLLPYVATISITALALIHIKSWRFLWSLSLGGSILWGLVALAHPDQSLVWATPLYALILGGAAVCFALPFTYASLDISTRTSSLDTAITNMHESTRTAHVFWFFTGLCISLSTLIWNDLFISASMLSLYCGISCLAAWRRQGFSFLVIMSAIVSFGLMLIWPMWSAPLSSLAIGLGIGFFAVCSALVFFTRHQNKAFFAIPAAISPALSMFIVFGRGHTFNQGIMWGLISLFIALILITLLAKLKTKDTDFAQHPGTAAAYVLGATVSVAIAPFLVFSGLWLGTTLAFIALSLAFTQSRFPMKIIQYAGLIAAAASIAFLLNPQTLTFGDWGGIWGKAQISSTPIFNEITLCLGLGIIALFLGARLMPVGSKYARAYLGGAAILGFGLIGLLIRHTAGNGSLDAPFAGFAEASGYAISYLGAASSLAWRRKSNSLMITFAEVACACTGFMGVALALTATLWDRAIGMPVFNLLATALLMPAVILGIYATILRKKSRISTANVISACAILLGLVWVYAETHRFFSGPFLSRVHHITDNELWVQSLAWILYAIFLLLLGTWRKVVTIRVSSLAIFGIAICKVFLFDMNELEGMARALSFIGLGVSLIGTALFYQRYVFASPHPIPHKAQPANEDEHPL